ncbi:hypothetical protein HanRHA438_Chr13g0621841 [Helianthus annuus]|nr:hypothetical protein HanRHA438_Chr13g0621841 [Helianthus annuus]
MMNLILAASKMSLSSGWMTRMVLCQKAFLFVMIDFLKRLPDLTDTLSTR